MCAFAGTVSPSDSDRRAHFRALQSLSQWTTRTTDTSQGRILPAQDVRSRALSATRIQLRLQSSFFGFQRVPACMTGTSWFGEGIEGDGLEPETVPRLFYLWFIPQLRRISGGSPND